MRRDVYFSKLMSTSLIMKTGLFDNLGKISLKCEINVLISAHGCLQVQQIKNLLLFLFSISTQIVSSSLQLNFRSSQVLELIAVLT